MMLYNVDQNKNTDQMKIISKCLLGVFCCAHFNMVLYAKNISIQQAEQAIDQKYAALDFYAVNQ